MFDFEGIGKSVNTQNGCSGPEVPEKMPSAMAECPRCGENIKKIERIKTDIGKIENWAEIKYPGVKTDWQGESVNEKKFDIVPNDSFQVSVKNRTKSFAWIVLFKRAEL